MTAARGVVSALVLTASTIAANAQSAWPSIQAPEHSAWPTTQPQQPSAWPSSAPAGPRMGGGFGGGSSPAAQQECIVPFTALRAEVEKRGMAAKAGGEKRDAREEMCKLVTLYSEAEIKWVKFAETNASTCGIPNEIIAQLKAVHAKTANAQNNLCYAGPAAVPTLSEPNGPYRWDPPRRPGDYKFLPRFSGR